MKTIEECCGIAEGQHFDNCVKKWTGPRDWTCIHDDCIEYRNPVFSEILLYFGTTFELWSTDRLPRFIISSVQANS